MIEWHWGRNENQEGKGWRISVRIKAKKDISRNLNSRKECMKLEAGRKLSKKRLKVKPKEWKEI